MNIGKAQLKLDRDNGSPTTIQRQVYYGHKHDNYILDNTNQPRAIWPAQDNAKSYILLNLERKSLKRVLLVTG